MAELWFPEAIVDKGNSSGDYTDLGEPKGLLHTTEGKTYAGARSAFVTNNSWPHATCSFETGVFKIWQHNPLNVASRALRNELGGVQTNRDNVVQLEIVGTADRNKAGSWGNQYVENFPKAYLDGIARWMRFVNDNKAVPNRCTVQFKTYPESYGQFNGVRLSGTAWDAYSGWLGHMHAPENTHGDPGLIDIAYLLAQAEEDDLPYTEQQLTDIVKAAIDERFTTGGTPTRVGSRYCAEVGAKDAGAAGAVIVRGDEQSRWWIATLRGKLTITPGDNAHVNFLVDLGFASAQERDANGNWLPFVVPQAQLDALPVLTA